MAAILQNTRTRAGGIFQTTNATPAVVSSFTMRAGYAYTVEAIITAVDDAAAQMASYGLLGSFVVTAAGAVTQTGSTRSLFTANETDAAWDCSMANSTLDVQITGTGEAAVNVNWRVDWTVREIPILLPN